MLTNPIHRTVATVLLVVFALVSILGLSSLTTSPEFYSDALAKLDEQKMNAMMLSAVVTVASTAISAIPDDTATPIAEQLSELTGPLLAIVCVLYAEKFMLTTMGWVSCVILLPAASLCCLIYLLRGWEFFRRWAFKLFVLGLVLLFLVPASVGVTTMVEESFSESVDATFHAAAHLSEETQQEDSSGRNGFLSFFSGMKDNISALLAKAKSMLSILVDAVAVLLVTSCVIPALTAILLLLVLRMLFRLPVLAVPVSAPALPQGRHEERRQRMYAR